MASKLHYIFRSQALQLEGLRAYSKLGVPTNIYAPYSLGLDAQMEKNMRPLLPVTLAKCPNNL